MKKHPCHLNCIAFDASAHFPKDASNEHQYWEIVCRCGGQKFDLRLSNRKSVLAVCAGCQSPVVIYDLAYYPAAVKTAGPESFSELPDMPIRPSRIIVHYEYGVPEPDMDFNQDDISWCQVFTESTDGMLIKVFDDETC